MKKTLIRSITLFLLSAFFVVENVRADFLDTWAVRSTQKFGGLNDVAWGNGIYVAVGSQIVTSWDGANWTQRADHSVFNAVHFAKEKDVFIAVRLPNGFGISGDGTNWIQRSISTIETILGVAEGAGKFVLSGTGGNIWTSDDAIDWNRTQIAQESESETLSRVSFCGSRFFISGSSGVWTSTDAAEWNLLTNLQNCRGVTFGNSVYVAACNSAAYVSTNGVRWQKSDFTDSTGNILGIAYGGGFFIGCGVNNVVWTSRDGMNWTGRTPPPASAILRAVASNNKNAVIVGDRDQGYIIRSDSIEANSLADLLSIATYPGITINGIVGRNYRIDATPDLKTPDQWRPIANVLLPEKPFTWFDQSLLGTQKRFYRAVLLP